MDCLSDGSFFLSLPAVWRWVCIPAPTTVRNGNPQLGLYLRCVPFAAMGFIKYNGMTAEQFVWLNKARQLYMDFYISGQTVYV